MKKIVLAVSALFATMGAAQAQTQMQAPAASPLRFLAGIGYSAGGDKLATAEYTNGSSQNIRAGGGFYFTGGADYRLNEEFSVQGTVNFHVDDTTAQNGSIRFKRFPIELMGYYHSTEQLRFGVGVRHISSAKLTSSGAADGLDVKFDSTTSGVAEIEYFWTPKMGMKVRYVKETFKVKDYSDIKVKGDHVGISGNYYF